MLVTIQLVLVYVVLVQGGSLLSIGLSGLGDATHTHHRYHTTNICHNVVLGSYCLTTSLYSIVPGLGGPSQSLVTSQSYLAFYKHIMPNPAEEEGARASNIQLVIKYPSFSWEGNQYENFKTFKNRTTILMEGPYKSVQEMDKVAAILGWLGDKGFNLYEAIDWEGIGKNKQLYKEVLDAFEAHFKPCQTAMHSWYQLGSVYSNQCKNQTEFMQKLKEIAQETGFRPAVRDELIKFLFVTHNTDQKVREYLLDKADPEKTCQDFLKLAKTVESLVKTENMSRELLAGAGKVPVGAIAKQKRFQSKSKSKERSDTPYNRGGSTHRQCKKCGKKHPPRKCPAYRERCNKCKGMGHFARMCRTKNPGGGAHSLDNLGGNTMRLKEHITHVVIVTVQDLKVIMNCMRILYK